ncbi:redoxin domain-containing protein [Sphaerisporangium sp. NPDC004334]
MSFLVAAVILVGVLCVLNLILMVGVIKRLREHTELLSGMDGRGGLRPSIGVGDEVGPFSASTVDGTELSRASVTDDTVVAFFSPNCQPCREKLPRFVEYSRSLPRGRDQAVAVVISSDPGEAIDFTTKLSPAAVVVVEAPDGPVSKAFEVKAYPTLLRVAPANGRLVVTEEDVELQQPATATA